MNIATVLSKAKQNFAFDLQFLRAAPVPRPARWRYVLSKYRALTTGSNTISYFGRPFRYDNRWTPALLQHYPLELAQLNAALPFDSIRTVLDVGANIGQFAATALSLHPNAQVWSLEPNLQVFEILEANSQPYDRWTVLCFGLAEADEERVLWVVPGKSGQGSIYKENAELRLGGARAIPVKVNLRRLTEEVCTKHGMPATFDLVKIDVEGYEREVLQGLAQVTWRYLVLETSVNRSGHLDDPQSLIEELWGPCDVVAATSLDSQSPTGSLVLARRDGQLSDGGR